MASRRPRNENHNKQQYYKKAMNFCHDPECKFGYGLEVHHIHPLGRGGVDEYSNYIVLCAACHRKRHVHSAWSEHQIRLLTYKLFEERLRIGVTSDEVGELTFHNALMEYLQDPGMTERSPSRLSGSLAIDTDDDDDDTEP